MHTQNRMQNAYTYVRSYNYEYTCTNMSTLISNDYPISC